MSTNSDTIEEIVTSIVKERDELLEFVQQMVDRATDGYSCDLMLRRARELLDARKA
jgi:hypothetical protein